MDKKMIMWVVGGAAVLFILFGVFQTVTGNGWMGEDPIRPDPPLGEDD